MTPAGLAEAWPEVVQAVGKKRRMLREALGHATPISVNEGVVTLEVSECEVHLEGLERHKDIIVQSIESITGLKVKILEYQPRSKDLDVPQGEPPPRLDRTADREQRLRHHRQVDPGLDSLAEALDLEVLE
jgi:hypothetical protein